MQVKIKQRRRIEQRMRSKDKWGFATKAEMLDTFKNDVALVNSMIASKTKQGLWKRNPECPDRDDWILYWTRLETSTSREHLEVWA